jgi:hypothetical protein
MWPKLVAYADDITVLTSSDNGLVNSVFSEYYRLTKASGLTLSADKTEKFDFYSRNLNQPDPRQVVRYGKQEYNLHTILIEKMARHFKAFIVVAG